MSFTISYDRHHIHFHVIGEGAMPILFFPGIHQDGLAFQELMSRFPQCTFYCIDMPFHGKSQFEKEQWTSQDVSILFQLFLKKIKKEKVGIGGFSIGGKIALKLVESIPSHHISSLFLLAPDGISQNLYYQIATKNSIGRKLFHYFLSNPKKLSWFGNLFYKLKLIPRHTYNIFTHSIQQTEQLNRIKKFWPASSDLQPNIKFLLQKWEQHPYPIYIFIGKKDSIISRKKIKAFYNQLKIQEKGLFELDINHNFTHPKATQLIYQFIENNIVHKCSSSFK